MDKYLGKRLDGRYEMRELIGVGGMAYVYKAYDSVDDRTVAVKILRDEFLTNEEFTRRFRNESKAIAILNHPNIVKVLDVGFGQHLQYIVMEYIDGITLKEYLDQRRDIRWKEAVHFTVQILRALQHAHDKGIVHRDIKPQNIMLLSDGTIKVTDFGIARLSRSELRATMDDGEKAIGSVHYISPEQARGEITDEKADIYSVGVVLYEMLTGRLPFDADNAVSVAIMQMQSEPTLPHLVNEDVPEGLEQITLKAMQKSADKRYQSAAEMLSDIDEFKRNPSIKFAYTYFVDETPTRYVDAITRVRGEEEPSKKRRVDKEEKKDGEKKKISTVAILAAVAATIVVAVVGVILVVFNFLGNSGAKDEMSVYNFVGKHYVDEVQKYELIGNYDIAIEEAYNGDYGEGYVFKQEPVAGTKIKVGGKVTLYISKGSKKVKVPMMTPGENAEKFQQRLDTEGFQVQITEESSDKIQEGTLIRLEPESGTLVEAGSLITMFVSSGKPDAEPIDMPKIIGLDKNAAIEKLVIAGFDQTKITVEWVNGDAAKNAVVGVSPDDSQKQYPDVNIKLSVSTGFRDGSISIAMPGIDKAVDLQFYVDGKLDAALTGEYKNIMPNHYSTLTVTTTLAKESYPVTVMIRLADKGDFVKYAEYQVNGNNGTSVLLQQMPFNVETDTSASSTTSSTSSTQTTTSTNSDTPNEGAEQ